jgi:hypothetical protein
MAERISCTYSLMIISVRVPAASPEFWEMRTAMRSRGIPDSRMPDAWMALCACHRVVLVAEVMVRKSCGEIPSSLRET